MSNRRATKRRMTTGDTVEQAEPVVSSVAIVETHHAVFCWPGPGGYRGLLAGRCGVIPRHQEVSLAPVQFKHALADGFEFVRWAGVHGPTLELDDE